MQFSNVQNKIFSIEFFNVKNFALFIWNGGWTNVDWGYSNLFKFIYKSPLPSKKVAMFEFTSLLQPTFFLKNRKDSIMEILDQLQPLLENIGFPALIFAIWYIYHQSQVKAFEQIIQNNFEILKDLLETNQFHAALLSRIESKIDNNLWCPLLKKEVN